MTQISLILLIFLPYSLNAFYYKRNTYGDAGTSSSSSSSAIDYVNSYYGLPSLNQASEMRRRPPFGLYPPQQQFFRREHPFDFGPVAHRIGGANENVPEQDQDQQIVPDEISKNQRENSMKKAKPGIWRRGETVRSEIQQKHEQIRRQLAEDSADIREKFADLHKKLVAKNLKLMRVTLKKMDKKKPEKIEEEGEKLELKAPENVEKQQEVFEQNNDQNMPIAEPLIQPQYPSQQSFSVVESRPIRVSQDGQTIEI